VRKYRFRLIVGGVSHCDTRAEARINEGPEIVVSRAASSIFEIGILFFGLPCNIKRSRTKFQFVFCGQLGDEFFVRGGGFAAQLVIEMNDAKNHAELLAQLQKQEQQRHRICASGHRNADTVAWTHNLLSLHVLKQLLAQGEAHG